MVNKYPLLENNQENKDLLEKNDKCDKYDYITAVACGALGGLIDIFFVGAPGQSVLGNWTDTQTNNFVMDFAKKLGWNPSEKNKTNVNSAIGWLENKFRVNYDQRNPSDVNGAFNIAPNTHHMMSLAHSPDIIGLFFSILNQFTSTSTFIANGKFITIKSDTFELQGCNFVMKLLCGIANWFCHLISDVAGSSGSHGRGTGIVAPFYELFGLCQFGSFATSDGKKTLAEIAQQAFTQGDDCRFAMAQAIPLVITELSIRLIWSLRQRFQYNRSIKDCIPTAEHPNLRVMLLIGNGTLCVIDCTDAAIRSGGNFLAFFMRLNLVAWFRFAMLVIKEVFIRVGIKDGLDEHIEAFKRINQALLSYLNELKNIDIKLFEAETQKYSNITKLFSNIKTEGELNNLLLDTFDVLKIDKPWFGDFDSFMKDDNTVLRFE